LNTPKIGRSLNAGSGHAFANRHFSSRIPANFCLRFTLYITMNPLGLLPKRFLPKEEARFHDTAYLIDMQSTFFYTFSMKTAAQKTFSEQRALSTQISLY